VTRIAQKLRSPWWLLTPGPPRTDHWSPGHWWLLDWEPTTDNWSLLE